VLAILGFDYNLLHEAVQDFLLSRMKKRFVIILLLSSQYNYKYLFTMKAGVAFSICTGILVDAAHLNSKFAFVSLWNMNKFYLLRSDTASILMLHFVLEPFRTHI
jgi:hypothetical protein